MDRSVDCPLCRKKVVKVKKNTTLNNLIGKYLEKHPDKKRIPPEIEELEKLNKITADVVEVLSKKQPQPYPLFSFPQLSPIQFPPSNPFILGQDLSFRPFFGAIFSNNEEESYERSQEESEGRYEENSEYELEEEAKADQGFLAYRCSNCLLLGNASPIPTCANCGKYFCQTCIGRGVMTKLQSKSPLGINPSCFNGNMIEHQHVIKYMNDNGLTFSNVYENTLKDLEDKK
jgi:hypothetical protein